MKTKSVISEEINCNQTGKKSENSDKNQQKNMLEKKCNKNVIKMKKGVAFCKQVCYNSGNLHKRKGVSVL